MRIIAFLCWFFPHQWREEGGRSCPKGWIDCSQPIYRCARCGIYDCGEPGGPGHNQCFTACKEQRYEPHDPETAWVGTTCAGCGKIFAKFHPKAPNYCDECWAGLEKMIDRFRAESCPAKEDGV